MVLSGFCLMMPVARSPLGQLRDGFWSYLKRRIWRIVPAYYVAVLLILACTALVPGMACSVHFVPYSRKEALVVPARAVHDEDDKYVVYLPSRGGKEEKREVTPGRSDGQHTEILAGLREGEEILVERPGPKTPAAPKGPAAQKGATP